MRCTLLLPALLLSLSPLPVTAARPPSGPPQVTAQVATQLDLEIAEIGKDGARSAITLSLLLPDRGEDGRLVELRTRLLQGERDDRHYYRARVRPESTPSGTRYAVELRRAVDAELKHADLEVEVTRILTPGVPAQLGRIARPDGTALIITATTR